MGERKSERRFDQWGQFRLMVRAEGYVMVRRPRAIPFVMPEKEWQELPLVVAPESPESAGG